MAAHGTTPRRGARPRRASGHPLGYDRAVTGRAIRPPSSSIARRSKRRSRASSTRRTRRAAGPRPRFDRRRDALPGCRALLPSFERTYADIDLAAYRRDAQALGAILAGLGLSRRPRGLRSPRKGRRLDLRRPDPRIHLDVFYDELEFCHVIPLARPAGGRQPDDPAGGAPPVQAPDRQDQREGHRSTASCCCWTTRLGRATATPSTSSRIARLCCRGLGLVADPDHEPREGRGAGSDVPAAR